MSIYIISPALNPVPAFGPPSKVHYAGVLLNICCIPLVSV